MKNDVAETEPSTDGLSNSGAMKNEVAETEPPANPSTVLPTKRLVVVFAAMLLSILLVALDQTILATALPRIASDFNAFSLQGWVATSFVLTESTFLLFFGQMLRLFPAKWVLVSTVGIFEIGSIICAASQNMGTLIAGRTISGVGAAGMFVALLQVLSQATRLEDRPKYMGMLGGVFGISQIIGPLIGGRWNFWISLPIGGLSMAVVSVFLKAVPPLGSDPTRRAWSDLIPQVIAIDWIGALLVAGSVTSLVLATQWGGNTKPWNDKDVIIGFVSFGVLAIVFVLWERHIGDRAMTPLKIFKSPSIYAIIAFGFFNRFTNLLYAYYLPIFYQVVRRHSAFKSGVDLLPLLLSGVVFVISSGVLVSRFGYYYPFLIISAVFLAISSGLFYTVNLSTSGAMLAGFQILLGGRVPRPAKLLGQAQSVASFGQFLGGMVGLSVAEPVFATELMKFLARYAPDAPVAAVRNSPTTYDFLPPAQIPGVLRTYVESLRIVFILGVPIGILSLLAAAFIKNIKIVKTVPGQEQRESPVAEEKEKQESSSAEV
ncbi:ABC transporter [Mycena alexandri]|uniref:ABC transporter n=1 Tax=Mycena alexandri TaxID=1745969 RepID=A0AAD6X528_9AGAR|nr:ABC transporter [Mycena alexandri]